MMKATSPSYSAAGITPYAPVSPRKMTTQTMSVVARLQALAKARDWDIDPAPVLRRGPSPRDRRPMSSAEGRDHRAGEDKRRHASRKPTPCGLMASGHRPDQGSAPM